MHQIKLLYEGVKLEEAKKALVMVHGRGATAHDILSLVNVLHVKDFAILAPQATNNSWYPYSFLAPPSANEPWLSSAIDLLKGIVINITAAGISVNNIYFLGFSQGACLTLEFVARHATKYGGVVAFTGGLIGDQIYPENYSGDFAGAPIFLASSDPDPHIPVERVNSSAALLKKMNAAVTENIYKDMGHTISDDEIKTANKLIFSGE